MKFGSFYGGEDDEHNSNGFVEISNAFMMGDEFFVGTIPFDGV